MPRKAYLSDFEKGQIIAYKSQELGIREIGRQINRSHNVVRNFLADPTSYGTKKTGGPKKKLSTRDERRVVRAASNSMISLSQIKVNLQLNVSCMTVCRTLKRNSNIVRQKMQTAPRLQPRHKVGRLEFARTHMNQDWSKVSHHI